MAVADRVKPPGRVAHDESRGAAEKGVESNARLTASTAVVLLVLLAAEGITILKVHSLVTPHVFIGMLLVPPVLLKIGTTSYRFVRYYSGAPAYRRKGPPPLLLRLLGPFLVVATVVVLGSGVALLLVPRSLRASVLFLHRASFVLWFGAMAVHVLGHLMDTAQLAPRDWLRRTRRQVRGAGLRQWAIVASVALGVPLGLLFVGRAEHWFAHKAPSVNAEHRAPGGSPGPGTPTPRASHPSTPGPTPTLAPSHSGTAPDIGPPTVVPPASVPTGTAPASTSHPGKSRPHHHGSRRTKH